ACGTNETALDYISRFQRTETTYDVESDAPLAFAVQPGDTVKINIGGHTGNMVVESMDWWSSGRIRLRGRGAESYLGAGKGWPAQPVGTIASPDRATISRALKPMYIDAQDSTAGRS